MEASGCEPPCSGDRNPAKRRARCLGDPRLACLGGPRAGAQGEAGGTALASSRHGVGAGWAGPRATDRQAPAALLLDEADQGRTSRRGQPRTNSLESPLRRGPRPPTDDALPACGWGMEPRVETPQGRVAPRIGAVQLSGADTFFVLPTPRGRARSPVPRSARSRDGSGGRIGREHDPDAEREHVAPALLDARVVAGVHLLDDTHERVEP